MNERAEQRGPRVDSDWPRRGRDSVRDGLLGTDRPYRAVARDSVWFTGGDHRGRERAARPCFSAVLGGGFEATQTTMTTRVHIGLLAVLLIASCVAYAVTAIAEPELAQALAIGWVGMV